MCYLCKAAEFIDNSVKKKSCYIRIFISEQEKMSFYVFCCCFFVFNLKC